MQHPHQQYGGYPQQNTSPGGQQPQHGFAPAAEGEPEYFGSAAATPSYHDNPGHTRAFSIGDAPDTYDPYPPQSQQPDQVSTYRAGHTTAPPAGPRLGWKQLLSGIVMRPSATFWQMRDHQVWGPALIVTFLYGLLAVFGFDSAREDVLDATLSNSVPWVACTAVAVILSGLTLGAVTNALARQLGGDGAWAPTVGLALLITSLTDAPRLAFAVFLGGANSFVQFLGWATWICCAALLTSMVSRSHDLPWAKALGAASIQLIALLVLFKLPVI
ncbi:Yip1 family protein [Streptomyces sp. ME01-24h]|nr:Yip1 family protein [Streptomyces sp. ME19-03-3]MDX3215109.1 Yip1 family protein [Streptomyces sp. ME02-6991-2B]MDX3354910.1 Yip1 family protein [Streptomyces sp. ME01-24h]